MAPPRIIHCHTMHNSEASAKAWVKHRIGAGGGELVSWEAMNSLVKGMIKAR
jgi:hypothetical protein